ncbi:MAG: iron uptake system protein EfeO [Lautropia sp.]|nr:iron uptake system protein EfeO [Lautropia sp.]
MPDQPKPRSALMRAAMASSVILVLAGFAAFWYASNKAQHGTAKEDADAITVTIQGRSCTPNEITVPAGPHTFRIVNHSDRALEWEILDGIMVVEERENIAPGFTQSMKVRLRPGDYDITCGLLSNPRGKLHVTASTETEAARPSAVNFLGALAEYRFYLVSQSSQLQEATEELVNAIRTGSLAEARNRYAPAHQLYKRIEPMAEMFSDLDQRINGRAEYFEKRQADPAFRGFHRLEYGLFGQQGNDLRALLPIAEQLLSDLGTLRERLNALDIPPERLSSSAAKLLRRTADNLPAGGEERWSHTEASDLQGTLDGTRKLAMLVAPLLARPAPALRQAIDSGYAAFNRALDPYRLKGEQGEGFRAEILSDSERKAVAMPINQLADTMGKANAALGLE